MAIKKMSESKYGVAEYIITSEEDVNELPNKGLTASSIAKLINEDGTIRIFIYYNENLENNEEGEKKIFQLSKNSLISIDSKKMIEDITQMLIESNDIVDKPRKIKDDESIADYLKYLDDYFKTRIVTIM